MSKVDQDPDHPILDSSWTWELTEFRFHRDPVDESRHCIDMVFEREQQRKRLRFMNPHELRIIGFPLGTGTFILDVTRRQLADIRVVVTSYDHGAVNFSASHVFEVLE